MSEAASQRWKIVSVTSPHSKVPPCWMMGGRKMETEELQCNKIIFINRNVRYAKTCWTFLNPSQNTSSVCSNSSSCCTTRERQRDVFFLFFFVFFSNPGGGRIQGDKRISNSRKPPFSSTMLHNAAATGLRLDRRCGPLSSRWEWCKLRPTPSHGFASSLKKREWVKGITMNT